MTDQEIFNQVYIALRKQGFTKSTTGDRGEEFEPPTCMYRGPDGLKCAVGHLIPDGLYESAMENKKVSVLIGQFTSLAYLEPHLDMLREVQNIHDMATGPEHMERKLNNFARVRRWELPQ